jgi:hypothetical protein
MKSHAEYSSTNRIHWNEVAPVHQNNYVNDLLQSISDPGAEAVARLFEEISNYLSND